MELRQRQSAKTVQKTKLGARLKRTELAEMGEPEFARMVRELETDPLYRDLVAWNAITRKYFGGIAAARLITGSGGRERDVAGGGSVLPEDGEAVRMIEEMGRETFVRLFLAPERAYTLDDIMRETGLPRARIEKIGGFVDRFILWTEPFSLPASPVPAVRPLRVIAEVRPGPGGEPVLEDMTFDLVRGRYVMRPENLERFLAQLPAGRRRAVNGLVVRMEWINSRRSLLYEVLDGIVRRQSAFFRSGREEEIAGISQRKFCEETGLEASLVCRVLKGRAVRTADGKIVPLRALLPGQGAASRALVARVLARDPDRLFSDAVIARVLARDFNVVLSRRAVGVHRKFLQKS